MWAKTVVLVSDYCGHEIGLAAGYPIPWGAGGIRDSHCECPASSVRLFRRAIIMRRCCDTSGSKFAQRRSQFGVDSQDRIAERLFRPPAERRDMKVLGFLGGGGGKVTIRHATARHVAPNAVGMRGVASCRHDDQTVNTCERRWTSNVPSSRGIIGVARRDSCPAG